MRRFFSPPPRSEARGGEGSGVGGNPASSAAAVFAEAPPPPAPPPPLRGGRGTDRTWGEVAPIAPALNSTKLGRNPASVFPAPVGAISSAERPARARRNNSS